MENRKITQTFWHNFFSILYLGLVVLAIYLLEKNGKLNRMISVFDFVILALATFRLIRLLVFDSITEHIREYFDRHEKGWRKEISTLISCTWCSGIWMAFIILLLFFLTPLSYFFILVLAIAGSGSAIQVIITKIGSNTSRK